MGRFMIQEPGIIGLINKTMPRNEMIEAVAAAFKDGSDAVRIGVTGIQDDLYVVSGSVTGDERFDSADGLLSFRELLAAFPTGQFNCLVPDRGPGWIPLYSGIIQEMNSLDRILTSSLYGKSVRMLCKKMKEADCTYSFTGLVGIYALFKSGLIYFKKIYRFRWLQTYEMIGPSYIASQGLIRRLRECGVKVQVFTQHDEKSIRRLYDAGTRYFITENPMKVRDTLRTIFP